MLDKPLCALAVGVEPLGLRVRAIPAAHIRPRLPGEAEPALSLHDRLQRARDEACAIGVLDAQDELPAVMTRQQPGIERGAVVADMRKARWAWRETRANGMWCSCRIRRGHGSLLIARRHLRR